jgi:GST-like protein
MLDFYFHATPNSMKVALLLEELDLTYTVKPVDIFKGEQHEAAFRRINPNGKLPAVVADGTVLFDSHAILLYLADTHQRFGSAADPDRASVLSWLQLVATGLSPFSGQAAHFLHYAPDLPYARNRYVREVERHYAVIDERLGQSTWLAGEGYSIADMALWGWAMSAPFIFGARGLDDYPNVRRLVAAVNDRPAAARAMALKARHTTPTEMDAAARQAMFPQNQEGWVDEKG